MQKMYTILQHARVRGGGTVGIRGRGVSGFDALRYHKYHNSTCAHGGGDQLGAASGGGVGAAGAAASSAAIT